MECEDVRAILSEYMDDVLDPDKKALVEKHLHACRACETELASLRAVAMELGSMKPVEPPKDFLDQLHRRMGQRSRLSRVLAWFFYPLRIKIPLQFAGAAAVAVLVLLVIRDQQPAHLLRPVPSFHVSTEEKTLQESIPEKPEEPRNIIAEGRIQPGTSDVPPAKRESADETTPRERVQADKGVEYKVDRAEPGAGVQPEAVRLEGRKPVELSFRLHGDLSSKMVDQPSAGSARAPANEKKRVLAAELATEGLEKEKDRVAPVGIIEEAIRSFDGKILSIEPSKDVGPPQLVVAEIPARNFTPFVEKLGEVGEIQGPAQVPSDRGAEGAVPLRIKLLPPQ
jgi:hypothetical protein